jgi:DNA-binding transcriptional regulator GbsR (MarR family)
MRLFNKYEKQIIELLLQKDITLSEIATEIGISKPTTSMYLKKLEESRIIKGNYEKNHFGRIIRYHLQPFHIIFSIDPNTRRTVNFIADTHLDQDFIQLGAIFQREFRKEVKEYLSSIITSSLDEYLIILYGSVAQGVGTRKSDIDLLFLKTKWSKKEKDNIFNLIARVSNKCNHQVKPLFKTVKEFEEMDKTLQKQIKENGITLIDKGKQWGRIKNQLKRYKIITI